MNDALRQSVANTFDASLPVGSTGDEALEILLGMIKTGKLDPWNLDIAQVADEYLKAVADLKASDLKVTGKMLLYLAILLRMKSDKLAGIHYLDPPAEEASLEDFLDGDIELGAGVSQPRLPFRSLDEFLERRTSVKEKRIRRVTLADLILELKKYEALEKTRDLKRKVEKDDNRRMRDYAHLTSDDIEALAHEEFIEDTILRLKAILERLLEGQASISLTELMAVGQIDKVSAFLAILFLTAEGAVDMQQETFYDELYITPYTYTPLPANGLADGVSELLEEAS